MSGESRGGSAALLTSALLPSVFASLPQYLKDWSATRIADKIRRKMIECKGGAYPFNPGITGSTSE